MAHRVAVAIHEITVQRRFVGRGFVLHGKVSLRSLTATFARGGRRIDRHLAINEEVDALPSERDNDARVFRRGAVENARDRLGRVLRENKVSNPLDGRVLGDDRDNRREERDQSGGCGSHRGQLRVRLAFFKSICLVSPVNLRLIAGTAILVAALAGEVAAQKPRPARPVGKNIEVEVMRGESVRIPLIGFERNLNPLEYKPIGAPSYGRLSQLQQYNGPQRQGPGHVTYTHGNDPDSQADTFEFEVKAPLTNMRGRGRVTIRIVDSPAVLRITPSVLEFGAMAIGDTPVHRTVELANVGGGVLQGYLEVPEPFALVDEGMFVLRRGEKTKIPIIFSPQRTGPYAFPIQPVAGDPAVLTLKGEALHPFAVEAVETEFKEQSDRSRTAKVLIANQSQSLQQISVILPPQSPIEPVPTIDIAPGKSTNVSLRIPPDFKTHLAPFGISFESSGHTAVLEFAAPSIPAELITLQEPDFGGVRPGTAAKASLVLSNAGGTVATCRIQTTNYLTTEDGASAFDVTPGTARTVALKFIPQRDQDLPTIVTVAFRDQELSIPVVAAWAKETPTPTPTATPTPTPTPPTSSLNDLRLEREHGAAYIAYREQGNWTNFTLQHRPLGESEWQSYQMPQQRGFFAWIQNLVHQIRNRLDTPIKRQEVEGLQTEERFVRIEIATEEIDGPNLWRLVALPAGESTPQPYSPDFRITSAGLVEVKPSVPVAHAPRSPSPATASTTRRPTGPLTEIASAGIRPERESAVVQVAFDHSLGIKGFRLERGAMVAPIDKNTGIPQAPDFERIDLDKAVVEPLGLVEGEAEGKKFTVCTARISGLDAGSRTYWRIIPEGERGNLPPTTVLLVDTLPKPPFPWNTVLLASLILLLIGVLYLRWRMNRIPS